MVGVKGKSGRKPNPELNYQRNKKISFYVKEYAETNLNGNITKWIEEPNFQWFKRKHGAQWQAVIRNWIRLDVGPYKKKMWQCKCPPSYNVPGNLHTSREDKCHKCGQYQNEIKRRIYERV